MIQKISWHGLDAYELIAGGYKAVVLLVGANCVSLIHKESDTELLRIPENNHAYLEKPFVYGIPILFPPNRVENGQFEYDNRSYRLPINAPEIECNIHGFLYDKEWKVKYEEYDSIETKLILTYEYYESSIEDVVFHNDFVIDVVFGLSCEGLHQTFTVHNKSNKRMPLGLGLHTALKLPFRRNTGKSDYSVKTTVGKRWERIDQYPSGRLLDLDDWEYVMRHEGCTTEATDLANHYTNESLKGFCGGLITHRASGKELVYEVDNSFRHWVIWNNTNDGDFICLEPMSWPINGPNLNLADDVTNVISLEKGMKKTFWTRLYFNAS